jgi:ligand-binding SRPBCC domain-containing protein
MLHTLRRRQWLPRGLRETFAFFATPENLPRITPPWLGFRIVTPSPIAMRRGLTIDYRVRVLGWPCPWRSVISEYDPPFSFRDEQVIGPYRRWDHRHQFTESGHGTIIEDVVTYEPPLAALGVVLDRLFIRRQLRDIFDFRRREIERLLLQEVTG